MEGSSVLFKSLKLNNKYLNHYIGAFASFIPLTPDPFYNKLLCSSSFLQGRHAGRFLAILMANISKQTKLQFEI